MLRARPFVWFLALSVASISACQGRFCNGTFTCAALNEARCPTVPGCAWAPDTGCQGKAERKCGDYEVEWCPGDLGCYVDEPHGFPDS
jgi:hypothetical protein